MMTLTVLADPGTDGAEAYNLGIRTMADSIF